MLQICFVYSPKEVYITYMFCVLHQVPDGATVALVPRHTKHIHHDNHDYVAGESEFTDGLFGCCRNDVKVLGF